MGKGSIHASNVIAVRDGRRRWLRHFGWWWLLKEEMIDPGFDYTNV